MANPQVPFGARLTNSMGGAYNSKSRSYVTQSTDAVALYKGDFVKAVGTGAVNEKNELLPAVTHAGAGDTITGIVIGIEPLADDLNILYRKPNTVRTVFVYDFPYGEFEIRANGATTEADFGLNANIAVGTADPFLGLSGTWLNMTSKTSDPAQIRIISYSSRVDSEGGDYAVLTCMINEHFYKGVDGI